MLEKKRSYAALKRINTFFKIHHLVILFLLFSVCYIYFQFSAIIYKDIFKPTIKNYYNYLLDAFFHGRTNVTSPSQYDLSFFQNKWYLYWGPAPVLFILPFYIFSHLQASDVLYTDIGGIINVILFYMVMQEFKKYFNIFLILIAEAFLLLSFSLASPNFFLAVNGQIWGTEQILATTYLLLFYLFYFRFLNTEKHSQLILCTVFFYLAFLSRYTLLLHGVLFLYLFVHYKSSGRTLPTKIIWSFALLTLAFGSLGAGYNYLRFHDILQTGMRFQVGAPRYAALMKSSQILSFHYIFHNFYYFFINSIRFSPAGRPIIDLEGNSVFSVYPALLLLPMLFYNRKYVDKKKLAFLLVAGIAIGLNIFFVMLFYATGWMQFGARYFLDVVPLLFLLLVFILRYVPTSIQVMLLLYGIDVNFCGVLMFHFAFS